MMTFRTLETISTEELLEVFNLSFSDYIIPFCLTKEQLEDKIKSDSIRLELSAGAFDGTQLVAFILHGYDITDNIKIVYNAGTGVVPAKRGNKLTAGLYEYVLPILHKNDIGKVTLEVITSNEVAIRTYKRIGFTISREFDCFKGFINIKSAANAFEIKELEEYDWQKLRSFWDIQPSWQNSITAVENLLESTISLGIYDDDKLIGYSIYHPKMKRIHQLAVDKNQRRIGAGRQLLEYISAKFEKAIAVINVDNTSKETLRFMEGIGVQTFIRQYEMRLDLQSCSSGISNLPKSYDQ